MFVVYYSKLLLPRLSCAVVPRFNKMSIIGGFSRKFPSAAHFNMIKRVIVCCECFAIVFCDRFYDWLMRWFVVFVMFCFERVFLRDCVGCLLWLILRLIDEIVFSDCLMWLIVPVGCFLLNGCDFWERIKIMVGRCIATLLLLNLT